MAKSNSYVESYTNYTIYSTDSGPLATTYQVDECFLTSTSTCSYDLSNYEVKEVKLFLGFHASGDDTDGAYTPTFFISRGGSLVGSWDQDSNGAYYKTGAAMTSLSSMSSKLADSTILVSGASPSLCSSIKDDSLSSASAGWLGVSYPSFFTFGGDTAAKWIFTIPNSNLTEEGKKANNWIGQTLFIGTLLDYYGTGDIDYQTNWSTFPRVILTLKEKTTTYTITASAGTGGSISPSGNITVEEGSSQTFTISPNTGYNISSVIVDGTNQGAVSSYPFNNITSNHTITASFSLRSYSILYNGNAQKDGSVSNLPSGQTKYYNTNLTLNPQGKTPVHSPTTSTGYTVTYNFNGGNNSNYSISAIDTISYSFKNWNTNSSGTGTPYALQGTYTANTGATLYAQWNSSLSRGAVTLPSGGSRPGYSFGGWSTSSSATSGSAANSSYTPSSNVTLYATWTPNTYTVSYDANGGSNAPSSQSFAYGTEITLGSAATRSSSSTITTTFSSRGSTYSTKTSTATTTYPFNGWALNSTSGTVYSAGAKYTVTGNVTFYAKWGNGSTTGSQVSFPNNPSNYSTTTTNGCSVTLNSNYSGGSNSTKTANLTTTYTFKNWNTNSSGTGTSYTSSSTYKPTSNTTLYAQWNSSSTGTITVTAADAPTRDGYNFIGWSETSTGINTEMEKTLSYTSAGSKTLYAQWEVANYITTLTYFTSSNNSNAAKVYYCEDGKTFIPIAKVHYYTGSTWTDVGNQIPYIE